MSKSNNITKFRGFLSPNYTQVPDELFDELMSDLSGAELKVLLYICRRTFGFKKDYDMISLNQIADGIRTRDGRVLDRGTGLSKRHVQRALASLEQQGIIEVGRQIAEDGKNEVNTYSLHFADGVGTLSPHPRDKMSPRVGTPVSTTINSLQNTVNNTVNVNANKNILENIPDIDQPEEKTKYLADMLVGALNDKKSRGFLSVVAKKIPESLLYQWLAEVKDSSVKDPRKVFTHKVKEFANKQASEKKLKDLEEMKRKIGG